MTVYGLPNTTEFLNRRGSISKEMSDYFKKRDHHGLEKRVASRMSNVNPVGSTSTLREKSRTKSRTSLYVKEELAPVAFRAHLEKRMIRGGGGPKRT